MGRNRFLKYLAAALVLVGIVVVVLLISADRRQTEKAGRRFAVPGSGRDSQEAYLYFAASPGDFLTAEKRQVEGAVDPVEFGRLILLALVNGPINKNLLPTLPAGTICRALYVMPDGTAYADFSDALRENHPGGSEAERITIFSIVNSLVLNVDEIRSVKILIDGREENTIAGHIDLRRPFEADMRIIK